MDEPDYPMLDVGDFEVLDECEGEDDDEVISYDGNEVEHINDEEVDDSKGKQNNESFTHVDENSADNTDNILDVSIDIEENEFLESVAKDFSENIEEVEERQRVTRLSSRREPTVQLRKLDMSTRKAKVEPEVADPPRKKPGPKSKTMNIQAPPAKKPIQRITFSDKPEKGDNAKNQKDSKNESQKKPDKSPQKNSSAPPPKNTSAPPQKNSSAPPQKNSSAPAQKKSTAPPQKNSTAPPQKKAEHGKPNTTPKKSVFLKGDLTDEEIMMHFDEIENTVLTSDSFVIQEEVDQEAKEEEKVDDDSSQPSKVNDDESQAEKKNDNEDEDWDRDADAAPAKKKTQLVVEEEEEELQESEMWYRQKLKDKQENIEIKFSKLAGLINYSYPCYKKWLDRNDTLYGTAICKVEPSRHIPLNQIHHNRWKFICNNKQTQQSAKEKENTDDTAESENNQSSWNVVPGVPDAKVEDAEEYPPFIMRAVKLFGEFLNNLESENNEDAKEESQDETATSEKKSEEPETSEEVQKSKENEKKKVPIPPDGFVILMRSNSANDIMMNITGKNISQDFKDKVKEFFLEGPGKDSNVKSFYCKTILKENNVISTESILLFGTETLDDTIGSIKISLPPKANMWANLAGVEIISKTVIEFLIPTQNTVVIEVGCGLGITSLLLASKCQKVIGIDIEKEVTEAKSLCSLNGITNVTFLTGKIETFLKEVEKLLEDSKAVAVINTNSVFGKTPKVIKGLRRLTTLGRIVLITNLTKQANRIVLELVQPGNEIYGNPFIPIRACLVDTTPKHFTFDIVMSMERRTMRNLLKIPPLDANQIGLMSKSKQEALKKNSETGPPYQKGVPAKFARGGYTRGGFANSPFNKYGKRPYAEDDDELEPGYKKSKPFEKPWQGSNIRPNPMYDSKKSRTADEEDLRARLSSNRLEPAAIVSEISEQKKLLDAAKEKLTGASTSVDNETVKKLQEMLNLAIEKTNKLQSQLPPRSVWDRIAPADNAKDEIKGKPDDKSPPMRGRFVKETGPKEIVITTANTRGFNSRPTVPIGKSKKYGNVPPAEPTLIEPLPASSKSYKAPHPASQKPSSAPYSKPGPNRYQESSYRKPSETWDKGKPTGPPYSSKEPPNRYAKSSPPRRPLSPGRPPMRSGPRQVSPPRRPMSPPVRRQPMLSPPRRPASPPRRAVSPPRRAASPQRRLMSPPRRPMSPGFRQHSSTSRIVPSNNRQVEPPRRLSPPRRPFSPSKGRASPPRQKSPPRRYADEWDIPTRGAVNESGWRPEKEKPTWDAQPAPVSSNWDQTNNSNNGNRYRPENSNWDNPSSGGQWKGPPNNSAGSNWDVKKDPPRHEPRHVPPQIEPRFEPRHEPRHEVRHEPPRRPMSPPRHEPPRRPMSPPRHEPPRRPMSPPRHEQPRRPMSPPRRMMSPPRHEPRHEPPRRPMSPPRHEPPRRPMSPPRHEARPEPRHEPRWEPPEKNDYDLPEDARDPWDDDPHPTPPKETPRWVPPPAQQSQPTPSWQPKPNFPMNNMGAPNMAPNPNPNMGMGMNMGMNNQKPPQWQPPAQPQPQQNRNPSWIPQGNWQGGGNNPPPPGAMQSNQGPPHMNVMNNWQPPQQQNFNNFQPARPFNSNPYMNNRR